MDTIVSSKKLNFKTSNGCEILILQEHVKICGTLWVCLNPNYYLMDLGMLCFSSKMGNEAVRGDMDFEK